MSSANLHEPSAYPPSQTALMFLDYQNILVNMVPSPAKETMISAAETLLKTARDNNVAIIHCLVDVKLDPPITSKFIGLWETQFKPTFSSNPELGAEYSPFAPTDSSTARETVHKRATGSRSVLVDPKLVSYLRDELGVKHLLLGGIATSGAILGTVSQGTDIGFVVSVVADACWDPNEQVHKTLVDIVFPSLAWLPTVEEAIGHMKE
ncbi:Isochorismatase hydrolase [Xylariaceae sp. FL1272]|nr:Isochorismatase hydrolase [Xylariaceae sp. FL1272]